LNTPSLRLRGSNATLIQSFNTRRDIPLIFVFGKNPIAAVIAIAFHSTGALAKMFSEVN